MPQPNDQPSNAPPSQLPADSAGAARWRRETDLQHLKLLSIFYYVFAGLQALGACGGGFYMVLGAFITASPPQQQDPNAPPPQALAGLFMGMGGCIIVFCLVWAGLSLYAGLSLARRQNRTFCMVVAGITCLSIPLGTILGIFTFVVLSRPSVVALFNEQAADRLAGQS